jgi:hypothetical protein
MDRKQKAPGPTGGSGQETEANLEIVSANLRALETIYFTAMLEEAPRL